MNMELVSIDLAYIQARWAPQTGSSDGPFSRGSTARVCHGPPGTNERRVFACPRGVILSGETAQIWCRGTSCCRCRLGRELKSEITWNRDTRSAKDASQTRGLTGKPAITRATAPGDATLGTYCAYSAYCARWRRVQNSAQYGLRSMEPPACAAYRWQMRAMRLPPLSRSMAEIKQSRTLGELISAFRQVITIFRQFSQGKSPSIVLVIYRDVSVHTPRQRLCTPRGERGWPVVSVLSHGRRLPGLMAPV